MPKAWAPYKALEATPMTSPMSARGMGTGGTIFSLSLGTGGGPWCRGEEDRNLATQVFSRCGCGALY